MIISIAYDYNLAYSRLNYQPNVVVFLNSVERKFDEILWSVKTLSWELCLTWLEMAAYGGSSHAIRALSWHPIIEHACQSRKNPAYLDICTGLMSWPGKFKKFKLDLKLLGELQQMHLAWLKISSLDLGIQFAFTFIATITRTWLETALEY